MTIHSKEFPRPPRGAAAVGMLDELAPFEAGLIHCLRLADDGPANPGWQSLAAHPAGLAALEAMGRICTLCARYGRRPLMRHSAGCACLGADEACLVEIVGAAMSGEREDAMLMASLMLRADLAPALVAEAQSAGAALARAHLAAGPVH